MIRTRFLLSLLCLFLLTISSLSSSGLETTSDTGTTTSSGGLETIFHTTDLLQDRNGDGVVDFVDVRLVMGDSPSPAIVSAAANVAARLGFETLAINLPLKRNAGTDGIVVVVGSRAMSAAGIDPIAVGLQDLDPGSGTIALIDSPGGPSLVLAGADDDGTQAAAAFLAGRFPHVWDPTGATLAELTASIEGYLSHNEAGQSQTSVRRLVCGPGGNGLDRVDVDVTLPSDQAAGTATRALEQLMEDSAEGARAMIPLSGIRSLRVHVLAPNAAARVVEIVGSALETPALGLRHRPQSTSKKDLDLSSLYENEGLLGDSDGNLIPDRIDALLSPSGPGIEATIDVAARLGLESAGIVIPVARTSEAIKKPESEPTLVLIGSKHPLIGQLIEQGKVDLSVLAPGQGLIQIVPKAFDNQSAVVVVGGDQAGLKRALGQLAERLPWIWERGRDRITVGNIEEDMYRLLSGRSPAGQAATALYKLDDILEELADQDLATIEVEVHVEKAEPGLAEIVRERIASSGLRADTTDVSIGNLDVQDADLLIEENFELPSEVETFWSLFRANLLPHVDEGSSVSLEVRLSEPPNVRASIARQAREELLLAGADPSTTTATVISAYKQGYSWLYDVVRPALEDKPVDRLKIYFAEAGPPQEWQQQAMYTPTRWLKETYPIDQVLANETDLSLEQIDFEMIPAGSEREAIYKVVATDSEGNIVHSDKFDPKFVVRPYFDRFPDYEYVRVTTGWLDGRVDGRKVVDERIVTDPEAFWDYFQSRTLSFIYDYVMDLSDGKPAAEDAPHFGELRIELALSEPDYRLGVDQERISSVESLHEEIYFATIHFFDVLGRMSQGTSLDYPGRIIPISTATSDGSRGQVGITFTGFRSPRPAVVVKFQDRDGVDGEARRDIRRVEMERPRAMAAVVTTGDVGVDRLDLRVKVDFEEDRRSEWLTRARAKQVDASIITAEQVAHIIDNLHSLRESGLYRDALAVQDLGEIRVFAHWEWETDSNHQVVRTLVANGEPEPLPEIATLLPAGWQYREGEELVQWKTPIPPPEAFEILAKMSTAFPEATAYKVGESYLGKELWAMDLMPPIEGSHWSQAKATTLKPTVVYSARQHANEVSSTSHVLKLAEMILTDPEYRKAIDKANVVIHPITNADGAQLAYDLYRITPDQMLHAGYLGSLGMDMTAAQDSDDPIYPETRVRPKLWRMWLPDIFLNPHGYPSHEWVQMFSEYAAWVRNRATEARDWWGMRGWFVPGFNYLDDPAHPRHKAAAMEIRSRIATNINAVPEIRAVNQRSYDRYARYGFQFDKDNFKMDLTDDVLIYTAVKGARADDSSTDFMVKNPKVTIWTGSTEAPDETAYDEWLELVATMGLQWDKAILSYLVDGDHKVDRKKSAFQDGVTLVLDRPRPPKTALGTEGSSGPSE